MYDRITTLKCLRLPVCSTWALLSGWSLQHEQLDMVLLQNKTGCGKWWQVQVRKHLPFRAVQFNYYNLKEQMHTIVLDLL